MNLLNFFTGGITKSIENIATEWIDTDKETAEARSLMIKTLDPNGRMRRDLSRFACYAYGFYLVNAVIIIYLVSFGVGGEQSVLAGEMMSDLFLPITTAWGTIVGASFGVNGVNASRGK